MRLATTFVATMFIGWSRVTLSAAPAEIVVTTTIQAAVDAALPGDTIRVPSGVYPEAVLVTTDRLTIAAEPGAILDGGGIRGSGIRVRSLIPGGRVDRFTLTGLQVQRFTRNGVILLGVDGFQIDHGIFIDNDDYGVFPIFSSGGLISFNRVSRSNDTGIYLGQSTRSAIEHNHVTDCTVGIDVELSTHVAVRHNDVRRNTIGMTTEVLPGLTASATSDLDVDDNDFIDNNRPNPVTDPDEILAQLPHGVGLLVIGADRVVARHNRMLDNDSAGIAIIQLPAALAVLDPRIDPYPDGSQLFDNIVLRNGRAPDPKLAPFPGADLLWDGSGFGSCWGGNRFRTSFPDSLPACVRP